MGAIKTDKMTRRLLAVVFLVYSLAGAATCFASSVLLQWNPVEDTTVIGYKVYYQADSSTQPFQGTGAAQGASPLDVHAATSVTVSGLDASHVYFFAVTAYNAAGQESPYSNIVSAAFDTTPPATAATGSSQGVNVALQSNGGVATASSTYSSAFPVSAVNNGDRDGLNWGAGGGWNGATLNAFPDWVQITFNGQQTISEIDVFTLQDNFTNPVDPTPTLTFSKYGITAFDVQYYTGTSWVTVPGGSISGNNLVWRSITFPAVTTNQIRVQINASVDGRSRLTEIEAY
jgi:hypothetical protein